MTLTTADQKLIDETDNAVQAEREATVRVLKNFIEIDRRRIFSAFGKGSFKEFVMSRYKFSEDEAWRRINAMKLLKEIPEVEEKMESGSISMTHLGVAQSLFKHESKNHDRTFSADEKLEVLEKMENTSTREAQRIVFSMASSPLFEVQDKIRPVTSETVEIKFSAPNELEKKLERLKGLLAHSHPDIPMAELIDRLCDLGLHEWDPARQTGKVRKSSEAARHRVVAAAARSETNSEDEVHSSTENEKPKASPVREGISAQLKREVWLRDHSRCCNCGSGYALQIDHVEPIAFGGRTVLENLRLLCRSCNQRAAIENFGIAKMQEHLEQGSFW